MTHTNESPGMPGRFIGAPNEGSSSGAAYIFLRGQGGPDAWGQASKLKAQDAAQNDNFGSAVSAYGDLALIGARGKSTSAGAAYVFLRDQNGTGLWGQVRKLTATDVTAGDQFGVSVAIDGDTAVVGAARKNNLAGAAYLFGRDQGGASNWGQAAKLTASDSAAADAFGITVAIDGDTAIVGAENKDDAVGAAYVYARDQGGPAEWGQLRKILGTDAAVGDRFGRSVGIAGGTILAGAFGRSGSAGAVYVFALSGGEHQLAGRIPSNEFAIDGDTLVARSANVTHIYLRNQNGPNTWALAKTLPVVGTIAVHGDMVAVGTTTNTHIFYRNKSGANNWGVAQVIEGYGAVRAMDRNTLLLVKNGNPSIFNRLSNSANWQFTRTLSVFGSEYSLQDDTLVIGDSGFISTDPSPIYIIRPDFTVPTREYCPGAVFIYSRNNGGVNSWGEVKRIVNFTSTPEQFSERCKVYFGDANETYITPTAIGTSVAVFGETIAIGTSGGAPIDESQCGYYLSYTSGTVIILTKNDEKIHQWDETQRISFPSESVFSCSEQRAYFGQKVALHGDTLIIGAPLNPELDRYQPEFDKPFSIFTFKRGTSGRWEPAGRPTQPVEDLPPSFFGNYFGKFIAFDGNTVIASQSGNSENGLLFALNASKASIQTNLQKILFDSQRVGIASPSRNIIMSNSGSAPFAATDFRILGSDAGDFFLASSSCSSVVQPRMSCTLEVAFKPSAHGTRSANLRVNSDAGNSPLDIPLSGTGIAPEIVFSATAADFSNQPVNTTSAMQSITLTNSGNSVLVIGSVTTSGNFAQLNSCGSTLSAGSSCLINITFTPTASGARSGTLTVDSNAARSPHTVALIGVGTAPTVQLFPSNLTFGSFTVGAASTTQSITLTNTGNSALTVSFIGASGDFVVTPNCPISLSPGAACDVAVRFQPLVSGPRSGSVTVMTNAPSSPDVVNLSGTGIVAPPALSIGDVSTTEGNSGTRNLTLTIALNPASNAPVNVTASTANGTAVSGSDFNGGSMSVSFAPGQTSKAVNVGIRGDLTVEADETFLVNLSNPTGGALLSDAQAVATIVNDDGAPLPSLSI